MGYCTRIMKIAIWHNLPTGGGKRALHEHVRALLRLGHSIEIWCPPSADQSFLPLRDLVPEHVVPLAPPTVAPTGRVSGRVHLATDIGIRMKQMEDHCRQCALEIARGDFDVLFVHPCQYFRSSPIALFTDLPNALYLQEPYRELYEAWPELPWSAPDRAFDANSPSYWKFFVDDALALAGKRVQVREERRWTRSFDQVLVNSAFSRESVIRTYNLDARVAYLGIDTEQFAPSGEAKEPYVIGLGNIYFNKRPDFAMQCIAAVPAATRPKLVWVGNFGDVDGMQRTACALGVQLETHVLIPHEQLISLLSRAAVMLYTSHLEPFGYAPLEANACGTVVVGIAEGGVRETVGHPDSGTLIPNLDAQAFADAIVPLVADLPQAHELGQRARRYVERQWSGTDSAERLCTELQRVIDRHPPARRE